MNRDCFARKTAQPIPNPCSSVLQTIGMLLCRDDFPNFTQRRKGAKHWIFLCAFAPLREHSLVAALPRCALRVPRGEISVRKHFNRARSSVFICGQSIDRNRECDCPVTLRALCLCGELSGYHEGSLTVPASIRTNTPFAASAISGHLDTRTAATEIADKLFDDL